MCRERKNGDLSSLLWRGVFVALFLFFYVVSGYSKSEVRDAEIKAPVTAVMGRKIVIQYEFRWDQVKRSNPPRDLEFQVDRKNPDFEILDERTTSSLRSSIMIIQGKKSEEKVTVFQHRVSLKAKVSGQLILPRGQVVWNNGKEQQSFPERKIDITMPTAGQKESEEEKNTALSEVESFLKGFGFDEESEMFKNFVAPFGAIDPLGDTEEFFKNFLDRHQRGKPGDEDESIVSSPTQPPNFDEINERELFFLHTDLHRDTFFVKELIPISWYLYTRGEITQIDSLEAPSFKNLWRENIFDGIRLRFERDQAPFFRALLNRSHLFALRSGEYEIDSFRLKATVRDPLLGPQHDGYLIARSSQPRKIRILPLPSQNIPRFFTGGVGDFSVAFQEETIPRTLESGDVLTFVIVVSGKGNAKFVELPRAWLSELLKNGWHLKNISREAKYDPSGISEKKFRLTLGISPNANNKSKNGGNDPREILLRLPPLGFFNPATKSYYESTGWEKTLEISSWAQSVDTGDREDVTPGPVLESSHTSLNDWEWLTSEEGKKFLIGGLGEEKLLLTTPLTSETEKSSFLASFFGVSGLSAEHMIVGVCVGLLGIGGVVFVLMIFFSLIKRSSVEPFRSKWEPRLKKMGSASSRGRSAAVGDLLCLELEFLELLRDLVGRVVALKDFSSSGHEKLMTPIKERNEGVFQERLLSFTALLDRCDELFPQVVDTSKIRRMLEELNLVYQEGEVVSRNRQQFIQKMQQEFREEMQRIVQKIAS